MPRRRKHRRWNVPYFLSGFPERLEQFKETSGLTWAELARRIGTNTLTVRRWRAGSLPNSQHLLALMDLAGKLKLSHLLSTESSTESPKASVLPAAGQDSDGAQVQ